MSEVKVADHSYRIGRLNARDQFHIVRRLAPILGDIAPAMSQGDDSMAALSPMADALAKMSDADADHVIFGLLTVVERKQGQDMGFGPVAVGTSLMYEDIGMPEMLQLSWHAFVANMQGFFAALPSASAGVSSKASAQSAG